MKKHTRFSKNAQLFMPCFILIILIISWITPAIAFEGVKNTREIVNKWNDVVVTVKVVTTLRIIVEGREVDKVDNEVETVATVIDPSGLVVLSNASIDPSRIYSTMLKQLEASSGGAPKFNIETEISDMKIMLSDGSELPASIALKDSDLDLAFVKPTTKLDKPIHALDLSNENKPNISDNIVILTRLGQVAGRISSISIHQVEAIIKKPRTFYVTDQNIVEGKLGAPVFASDGKVVGILLLRVVKPTQKGSPMVAPLGINTFGVMPVILPADEVMSAAKQIAKIPTTKQVIEIKDKGKLKNK